MPQPRKPTALKLLDGESRPCRLPQNEPKPRPVKPSIPAYLNDDGRRRWQELEPELSSCGVLTIVDGEILGCYCQAYQELVRLSKRLAQTGRTYRVGTNGALAARPEVAMLQKAKDDIRRFGAELGIGAASRSKIEVKKPDGDENPLADIQAAAEAEARARRRQG